jgi:hypothetical protein
MIMAVVPRMPLVSVTPVPMTSMSMPMPSSAVPMPSVVSRGDLHQSNLQRLSGALRLELRCLVPKSAMIKGYERVISSSVVVMAMKKRSLNESCATT